MGFIYTDGSNQDFIGLCHSLDNFLMESLENVARE